MLLDSADKGWDEVADLGGAFASMLVWFPDTKKAEILDKFLNIPEEDLILWGDIVGDALMHAPEIRKESIVERILSFSEVEPAKLFSKKLFNELCKSELNDKDKERITERIIEEYRI